MKLPYRIELEGICLSVLWRKNNSFFVEKSRTATVVCRENIVLATLAREDYNRLLCRNLFFLSGLLIFFAVKIYKTKDDANLAFLKTINIFSHLPNSALNEIYFQLQRKSFTKKHVFYREGQAPDNIYFVLSGEVEVAAPLSAKLYLIVIYLLNSSPSVYNQYLLQMIQKKQMTIQISALCINSSQGIRTNRRRELK